MDNVRGGVHTRRDNRDGDDVPTVRRQGDGKAKGVDMVSAKQYMRRAYHVDGIINAKLKQIRQLKYTACMLSRNMTGDKVQANGRNDKVAEVTANIVDLENEINNQIDALVDYKRDIITVIEHVPEAHYRLLLQLRYVNFYTWEKIAVEMNYCYRQVLRIHGEAIAAAGKIISLYAKDVT